MKRRRRQAIAHRILKRAALAVVQDLMGRRLPHVQDRLRSRWCGLIFSCIMIRALLSPGAIAADVVGDQTHHQLRH